MAPIQVRIIMIEINNQNFIFMMGLNLFDIIFVFTKYVKLRIEAARAMTPPSFEGIARRIAYANKKYHSG